MTSLTVDDDVWPADAPETVLLPGGASPLAAYDVGPAGSVSRRPALLVPGYTGSKEDFAPLLPLLAAAGHRVLAYDQRGQYESVGPQEPSAYSVAALAADLLALVDELTLAPVHLVGHSFGGLVARAAVVERPAAFASLTLLGSGPAALPEGPRTEMMRYLQPLLAGGGLTAVWEATSRVSNASTRANSCSTLATIARCSARGGTGIEIESHFPLFKIAMVVLLDFAHAAS